VTFNWKNLSTYILAGLLKLKAGNKGKLKKLDHS
jgi:hypothetical protein